MRCEAKGEASGISTKSGYDQYVAEHNTESAYFLGEQYEGMAGLMYLVYGVGQQVNASVEALRAIKVQRMAARTAVARNELFNERCKLQAKNTSAASDLKRIKELEAVEQSGAGNKRINKGQIEKKGLKIQQDADLQAKMREYQNAKTSKERGDIGEEISEIVAQKAGLKTMRIKLNGSDHGFDLIAYEGTYENPTVIYIFESKPILANRIVFNITSNKGVQTSAVWRKLTIDKMLAQPGDVGKTGKWLRSHEEIIEPYTIGCNKSTGDIFITKQNKTY